jgi:integrase/recombinase XerD
MSNVVPKYKIESEVEFAQTAKRIEGAKSVAKKLAKHLRKYRPDYTFLSDVFKHLRSELNIEVKRKPKKLPLVPMDGEVKKFWNAVCAAKTPTHMVLIKVLLFTGCRVSEVIKIKMDAVDISNSQISIVEGKGKKDCRVCFPDSFRDTLVLHIDRMKKAGATHLLESGWKKPFAVRTVNYILEKYSKEAGLPERISAYQFRHFLFMFLKKQGIDDAMIQPISGHSQHQTLEIYSRLSIADGQAAYNEAIGRFIF